MTMSMSMNYGAAVLYEALSPDRVRVSSGVMAA